MNDFLIWQGAKAIWEELRRRPVRGVVGTALLLLVVSAGPAAGGVDGRLLQGIRAVAEGILGTETVKVVRVLDGGATVVIRWESATYRITNQLSATRTLLHAEAALVSGAILGRFPEVRRLRFAIIRGDRILAGGETGRPRALTIAYAPEMGGGTYTSTDPTTRPGAPGSGSLAPDL